MKAQEDKNIQDKLDNNLGKGLNSEGDNLATPLTDNEKIYRLLYQELEKEPGYQLPVNFANRISANVQKRYDSKILNADNKFLIWATIGMLVAITAVLWIFNISIELSSLSMSANLFTILAGGIIVVILIQIADHKLLKSKIYRL